MQTMNFFDGTHFDELTIKEQLEFINSGHTANDWIGRTIYEGDVLRTLPDGRIINTTPWTNMLENAEFSFNHYDPEGDLWELVATDEETKAQVCQAFAYDFDEPEQVILQCREDFTNCVFYCDGTIIPFEPQEFFGSIEKFIEKEVEKTERE